MDVLQEVEHQPGHGVAGEQVGHARQGCQSLSLGPAAYSGDQLVYPGLRAVQVEETAVQQRHTATQQVKTYSSVGGHKHCSTKTLCVDNNLVLLSLFDMRYEFRITT